MVVVVLNSSERADESARGARLILSLGVFDGRGPAMAAGLRQEKELVRLRGPRGSAVDNPGRLGWQRDMGKSKRQGTRNEAEVWQYTATNNGLAGLRTKKMARARCT